MGGQLESYRKEVFDFLRTVVIKFDPFAEAMGEMDMQLHGLDTPHGAFNKYYINLLGHYGPGDEKMYIYSHEEERMVLFDKEIHTKYPKSASIYKVGTKEYTLLEEKYPANRGLIQAIAYPIDMTMDEIIAAPNLSLVGYDASLLHINERESLISHLKEYLNLMATRWWVKEYSYEDMYPLTFWGMMWQSLPMVLMTKRYENIRTPYAHPYHIWEYLLSKGLGDYRDILSNTQSLWLYRNMVYILANKGKYNNLQLLADNILREVYVSLLYKDMRQNNTGMSPRPMDTEDGDDITITTRSMAPSDMSRQQSFNVQSNYFTIPEFVSYNVLTDKPTGEIESFSYINSRMLNSDMEYRGDLEFVANTEASLGIHSFNELPTKIMELKKEPIDTSNEQLVLHFLFDNLMYNYSTGLLNYKVTVTDPYTAKPIKMDINDAILLLYWTNIRSIGEMPNKIPNKYTPILAFKTPVPAASDIPTNFYVAETKLYIDSYINVELLRTMMGGDIPALSYSSVEDYMQNIATKYGAMEIIKERYKQSCSYAYHQAMNTYLEHTLHTGEITVDLTSVDTFQEWYAGIGGLSEIIDTYENETDNLTMYSAFAVKVFDAIFPLLINGELLFNNSTRAVETLYAAMRDLFIQLCSYHINFLEGARDAYEYVPIIELSLFTQPIFPSYDQFFNMVIHPLGITTTSHEPIAIIEAEVSSHATCESITFHDSSMEDVDVSINLEFQPESRAIHYVPMVAPPIEQSRKHGLGLDFSIQWGPHVD